MEEVVTKPWGFYQVLLREERTLAKHLMVYPGKRTSLQKHLHRDEAWKVLVGKGKVSVAGEYWTIKPGDVLVIRKQSFHRVENIGEEILVIHEVQTGNLLSEDDIIRVEDDYGRV